MPAKGILFVSTLRRVQIISAMGLTKRTRYRWSLRSRTLQLGRRTAVMGVVNVTPDSFSDGGRYSGTDTAVEHALRLIDEGADIVDVGGESTRPGAPALTSDAISAVEEQRRVLPVIAGVLRARPSAVISVDTYRADTARAAVLAGAEILNDVSGGLWDAAMLQTCAELGCGVILMHTRGLPSEWAQQPRLREDEIVPMVLAGLQERLRSAHAAGIARERIVLDPGFGFGKRGAENWALLRGLHPLHSLGYPVLAGLSRKGFLSQEGSREAAAERDDLTHTADTLAIAAGAHMVRVHEVRGAVRSAAVADAVLA